MFEILTRFWTPEIHFWRMRNYINGYSVIRSGKGDECYGMWENRSCVWKKFWTRKRLTKISPDSMHLPYANTPLHRELLAAYSFKYWAKQLSPLKRPLIHQDKSNWIVQNIFVTRHQEIIRIKKISGVMHRVLRNQEIYFRIKFGIIKIVIHILCDFHLNEF